MSRNALRDGVATVHGPPKIERRGEKIMQSFNSLVPDRTDRTALLQIARALDVRQRRLAI
jgi:propanediol dehydratase small subunit